MSNISRERIIETAANLSNKAGLENLSLKMIAEELKIKSPSLYNHVSSLDDIKKQLMLLITSLNWGILYLFPNITNILHTVIGSRINF